MCLGEWLCNRWMLCGAGCFHFFPLIYRGRCLSGQVRAAVRKCWSRVSALSCTVITEWVTKCNWNYWAPASWGTSHGCEACLPWVQSISAWRSWTEMSLNWDRNWLYGKEAMPLTLYCILGVLFYLNEIIHFRVLCGSAGEMYFMRVTNWLPCASVNVISIDSSRGWGTKTDPESEAGNGHCMENDLNNFQKLTDVLVTWLVT